MAVLGPVGENEVILGYDHKVHVVTLSASASEGAFILGEPGVPDNFTSSLAYNVSAATMQAALRTISGWEAASVSGSGPWTVTLNSVRATYAPLAVMRNTTGYNLTITSTPVPCFYPLAQPVRLGTMAPLAGKTIIASNDSASERAFQPKASEWLTSGPIFHGHYKIREQENAAGAYFIAATTHLRGAIFGLPKVDTNTMAVYASVTAGRSVDVEVSQALKYHRRADGRVYSVTNAYPGRETSTLLGTVASPIAYGTLCRFRGTLFIPGGTGAGQYYYWASSTFTAQAVSGASPFVAFEVMGDRLFSVDVAGQIRYTTVATPASADWTAPATLIYRGSGYVLQLIPWKDPATGTKRLILAATDGMYLVDDEAGIVDLLGDLKLPVGLPCDDSNVPYTSKVAGVKDGNLVFISGLSVFSYNGSTLTDMRVFGPDGISRYQTGGQLMAPVSMTVTRHYIIVMVTGVSETSASPMRPSAANGGSYALGYTDGWSPLVQLSSTYDSGSCVVYSGNGRRSYLYFDKISMPWNDTLNLSDYRYGLLVQNLSFTTGWFDRGMPDVTKVFWDGFMVVSESESSGAQNIAIFYQSEFADDSISTGGLNPVSQIVPVKDADGVDFAPVPYTGITIDGIRTRFYFDRVQAIDSATYYSHGAVARTIRLLFRILTDLSQNASVTTTNASTTITTSGSYFVPTDVGKAININTTTPLNSVIVSVTNSTTAILADPATSTQSGRTANVYRYPVLEILGVSFDGEYDRTQQFPLALALEPLGGVSSDGRTAARMQADLHAALDYRGGLPFAYYASQLYVVNVDSMTVNGGGTGLNPEQGTAPIVAGVNVSERVLTR